MKFIKPALPVSSIRANASFSPPIADRGRASKLWDEQITIDRDYTYARYGRTSTIFALPVANSIYVT